MKFLIGEVFLTALFSTFLFRYYADKNIHILLKIVVISTWFLNFLGIFILPLDIYYSNKDIDINIVKNNDKSEISSDKIMNNINVSDLDYKNGRILIKSIWNIIYWIIYVLSWVIIPIYQEYEQSGDFSVSMKLKRSLRKNLYFYFIISLVGFVFVLYMIFKQNFTFEHVISFLISTSNGWGILMIIFLLGYGLISLPKLILLRSETEDRIRYLESYSKEVQDELNNKKDYLNIVINVSKFKI